MSNKVSSKSASRLLDNKLDIILSDLKAELQTSNIAEKEELLMRMTKVISRFYKTLNSPLLTNPNFRRGVFVDYSQINKLFLEVEQDIRILYKEINSLESFLTSNFNSLSAQATALRSRLRRAASKLGDFKMYARDNLGGATYFTDTFQSTDKIDYDKEKYENEIASIDISAGDITLPIDINKVENYTISEISIGDGSNGFLGNNQEVGALYRGELKSLSDSNADTWVEYESVSDEPSAVPLILELKMTLEKEAIVNVFNVSTTAFATRSYPKIIKVEVSKDGKAYTELMDKMDTATFLENENEKVIQLNPSTGKFSGISKIKIPPLKIKYIKLVFQQDDSYIIKTSSGLKYRKAIGIRDINFSGEQYKPKGEIVSAIYTAKNEIKKVSLITKENTPNNSTIINHYVSLDNGQNWNEIQSLEKISNEKKEVLSFNIEGVDSIKTLNPSASIKYKAVLSRENSAVNVSNLELEKIQKPKTDFTQMAAGTQEIILSKTPVKNSIIIKNVSYGSVGGIQTFLIDKTYLLEKDGFLYAYLPHSPFKKNTIKKDTENIIIDKEYWERVPDISIYGQNDKVYEFDYLNNIIKFGNDISGKKPKASIHFSLKREKAVITQDNPRIVKTKYSHDGEKDSINLYRFLKEKTIENYLLPKRATVIRLNYTDIKSITTIADPADTLNVEKVFINGASELNNAGDYSVDYENGIIYTYQPTSEIGNTIINFTYYPRKKVENIIIKDNLIQIEEGDYVSEYKKQNLILPTPTKTIEIEEHIEPKSIKFLSLNDLFKTEVKYIGDGTEFNLGLSSQELEGYYCVDYENGIIYTYSDISGDLSLEYYVTNYFIEYNIAVDVEKDSFTVDEKNNKISFTNKYILQTFNTSLDEINLRSLFKIDYEYIEEVEQNPKELQPYITPILQEYSLAILTKDDL